MLKRSLILVLTVSFPMLASINTAGMLVIRFGNNGTVLFSIPGSTVSFNAATVDNQQRIVVVGQATGHGGVIARFLSTGALDTSFNSVGYAFFYYTNTSDLATSVVIFENNIYIGGDGGGSNVGFITSFTSGGSRNANWGTNGIFGLDSDFLHLLGLQVQQDGKVVVCGSLISGTDGYVARTNAAGTALDASFNADGTPGYQTLTDFASANGCAVAYNGTISVVANDNTNSVVYVLTPEGEFDASYHGIGVSQVITGFAADVFIIQPGGAAILGGYDPSGPTVMLKRLTPAGVIDTTFGDSGTVEPGIQGYCLSLMLTLDNNFFVGCADTDTNVGKVLAYGVNGLINPAFGYGGSATLSSLTNGVYTLASAQNGNIVLTSSVGTSGILQELTEYQCAQVGISSPLLALSRVDQSLYQPITPTMVYKIPVPSARMLPLFLQNSLSGF